ncbi:MAG TPA: ammonium transporter [Verrucomicrobia bacterium]|nr:ammonium transporter [Verrucomicrobiota bacterium]
MRKAVWGLVTAVTAAGALVCSTLSASAQEAGVAAAEGMAEVAADVPATDLLAYTIDNLFLFIGAVLVIFMQPGFAMVETGFNAAKNTVNILFKNVMDLCVGVLLYYLVGYGLMYGAPVIDGFLAWGGVGVGEMTKTPAGGALHKQVDFLFQVAFAATAATIVSGSVAGRMKFSSYLIYSAIITGLIYPISGFWKWGGGWLHTMGFYDFAGSILVHAVGGFAGLAGAIVLGPRMGRFNKDGKPRAMPGHNLPLAALGVFILWTGWYGFNPASQLAIHGANNTAMVMKIAVNTTMAAAAGGVVAMIVTWALHKKPELSMALNGILAGLVGITANCSVVTNTQSILIGAIAGALVVGGIKLLDKLRIDDPVGAWPVHGLCGVWGGLATWIFGDPAILGTVGDAAVAVGTMKAQLVGSVVVPLWSFVTMIILFSILKAIGMLRVSPEEEVRGLDIGEHGEEAYKGFQIFATE